MATSAFKSTSRRGATEPKAAAAPSLRRSHSVSAASRKIYLPFDDTNSEFSIRRDNPLFWTGSNSPPDKGEVNGRNGGISSYSSNARSGNSSVGEQRGRSVTRSASSGVENGIGRSLSRVRGRSVSRAHDKGVCESEKQLNVATSTTSRSRNQIKPIANGMNRSNSVGNRMDTRSHAKNVGLTRVQNQATVWSEDESAFSFQISSLEDVISTGSLSEAEEKTIKAVCESLNSVGNLHGSDMPPSGIYETVRSEVRRAMSDIQNDIEFAFRRNNTAIDVPDTPPDFVNPEAVEFESDIRREYAIKLQESEERAKKLRTDLAIEEHRGQELDKIVREMIPNPKNSSVQRTQRGRRTSNERKRMSRRLNEEAMAYFDECVSLSTFDSSDFSASEDPNYSIFPAAGASPLEKGSSSTLCSYNQGTDLQHKQLLHSFTDSVTTINNSPQPEINQPYHQFSFAGKQSEKVEPHEDIMSYIKHFEKSTEKDVEMESTRSYCDADEYNMKDHFESVLIDRVMYSKRIESGGLLLCGGAISVLPFPSVI